ncbi:tRNA pseudouridine(38-40) synthase TruA [Bacillus pseudomycoides]|uniref:tRNA pseudouridine(38-40) synthase TruA n=1 Tax=Bacillus pseudomycoides TaxID=64104 RepID=UPI000BEDCD81|nr:tRNA pseudouridine(38-40) synthase TruA [Bacillus pseudomycoides]PDY01957.1 tRNA pseudouridine(38-40) synthase TruA [Bacillus pseudomycoides]PEK78229.1 tRNA pseudouridine(38-40) synthase TruA [Bacillus pseudomycoides]PEN04523.1 tRNA pseudouridine(38-40) synthase TruA [Bacillus pseudomycoides]PGB85226.1 tRNA pseudouridine(38-40) synthase TruA [Bacillus pseudomycoides]PHE55754.1 tRNA pseudouridine(38-40) synthase TruA [Bacillus pseudomycoides]
MNNYKLTIQYDGGRYKGWQRLGNNDNTIQGKIESVLSEMTGREIEIIGCSRTDAGVHALHQVANFKIDENLPELKVKKYLNQYLPNDISIIDVELVSERFHARYNSKSKTYLYKIWNEEHTNPFMRKYSMHVGKKLNIENMQKAAQYLIGSHDFTAFSNAKSKKKSMVREIYMLDVVESEGFIQIRVNGNGFLHNMVRKIVGALVEVGLGQLDAEVIPQILEAKQRNQINCLADASGLYLEKVDF